MLLSGGSITLPGRRIEAQCSTLPSLPTMRGRWTSAWRRRSIRYRMRVWDLGRSGAGLPITTGGTAGPGAQIRVRQAAHRGRPFDHPDGRIVLLLPRAVARKKGGGGCQLCSRPQSYRRHAVGAMIAVLQETSRSRSGALELEGPEIRVEHAPRGQARDTERTVGSRLASGRDQAEAQANTVPLS